MDLRIYRDGKLIEPILPGRAVVEGNDAKNHRFIDQAYAGSYSYSPDDFQAGNEFRIEIIDARKPDAVHKEADSNVRFPHDPAIEIRFQLSDLMCS